MLNATMQLKTKILLLLFQLNTQRSFIQQSISTFQQLLKKLLFHRAINGATWLLLMKKNKI